ncbi:MAG TPA: tRNA (adenosine(37)-N6)-dimethylallyltransferase MiaA [Desulfobulbus sp.]|nr:tRNA (adenosine(37)-N6)-dimethylallyltransferase MiaA [Desulfobulbus sp.]
MTESKTIRIDQPVLVLVGPTAIGKTALSFEIVDEFGCEIISMDSMQVYRHMDIGTAKPSKEELLRVRHHLIDLVDPDEQYNAARFVQDCLAAIDSIIAGGKIPLITGGTGLYLSSLLKGLFAEIPVKDEVREELGAGLINKGLPGMYEELCRVDPVSAARIHQNDQQRILRGLEIYFSTGTAWSEHLEQQKNRRPPVQFTRLLQIGLTCERKRLYRRIEQRSGIMLEQGLIDEVKKLRAMGYDGLLSPMQAIGYRHVNQLLDGHWDYGEMKEYLVRDTRRYAKRQMTWFGRSNDLHWYDRLQRSQVIDHISKHLSS